ncbi:MAG: hypothetical protein JXB49_16255 [Bacteroidales bacterium]|nr:hypothetical protein [Bacteroidales bacterium]
MYSNILNALKKVDILIKKISGLIPFLNLASIALVFLLFLASCNQYLPHENLVSYINDPKHGLVQEKISNGYTIKLTYKPSELIAWQEIQILGNSSKERINEILSRYDDQYYFVLSFSHEGKEILGKAQDMNWFNQILSQLSFNMQENVSLIVEEKDTLQVIDYSLSRTFGMASSSDVLLSFKRIDYEYNKTLVLQLKEMGLNTGNMWFHFKTKDINKIPKLRYDL